MQVATHPVFNPSAHLDSRPTDLIMTSADRVQFHVHRDRVVTSSTNCFNLLLLPNDRSIELAEPATLLAIIFYLIYDKPFDTQPDPATILASFDIFRKYGLPLKKYFSPPSQLFAVTHAQILTQPVDFSLQIYTQASQDDLFELAKAASPILLSLKLPQPDETKLHKIHPIYLNKLYALHMERMIGLRKILKTPPLAHAQTTGCSAEGLLMHWDIKCSEVVLASELPDVSSETIRQTLSEARSSLTCEECKKALEAGIDRVVHDWEATKNTI
ncbi:hypothetical protein QCA50_003984 [Cerrena zonata]|uniref:BTB domain-containing protein n=1 Tax=Cerrena zonata TaxID=2478898 RepID=A0AAW0GMJ0_9APHY